MKRIKGKIKQIYQRYLNCDTESKKFIQLIKKNVDQNDRILDVGCGYGRLQGELKLNGYNNYCGVEINPEIVNQNRHAGLSCILPEDLDVESKFDVLIMSHIIEHFSPTDLLKFIEFYLDHLKVGVKIFILTPLYTSYFYDDFDHIKPYHPNSIQMVFGGSGAQVQFQSRNKLVLQDLWFRSSPYFSRMNRARYFQTINRRFYQMLDFISASLFKLSKGVIGQKDAWMGVFQKVQ
jgi:SAM-dependent methyltransferase